MQSHFNLQRGFAPLIIILGIFIVTAVGTSIYVATKELPQTQAPITQQQKKDNEHAQGQQAQGEKQSSVTERVQAVPPAGYPSSVRTGDNNVVPETQARRFGESLILTVPPASASGAFANVSLWDSLVFFSPDYSKMLYKSIIKQGEDVSMLGDGDSKKYDFIDYPAFSPDYRQEAYAYVGQLTNPLQWSLVVNGKETQSAPMTIDEIVFSNNGASMAYRVQQSDALGEHSYMVVNGKKGSEYALVLSPVFSLDGRHFAYIARKGNQNGDSFIVVDGKETKLSYNAGISDMTFSPDGRHFAYIGTLSLDGGKKSMSKMVLDGVEQPYDRVSSPVFSQSGTFAYIAGKDGKNFIILDGTEQKKYDFVFTPVFSLDSKHFAFMARQGGKMFAVLDGVEKKSYFQTREIQFGPDSVQFSYIAMPENGQHEFVVLNDKEQRTYQQIYYPRPLFSPDSKHLFYKGHYENAGSVGVLDGTEQKKYDDIDYYAFSPDSRHLAYRALRDKKYYFVIDGKEGKAYDWIAPKEPYFDDSDAIVTYGARNGNDIFRVTVDLHDFEK